MVIEEEGLQMVKQGSMVQVFDSSWEREEEGRWVVRSNARQVRD